MAKRLVVLADTSAWIAYLRGYEVPAAIELDKALDKHRLLMGDLVLVEILRGIKSENEAQQVLKTQNRLRVYDLAGHESALRAAANYRVLRSKGITVRGTVDLLIATWCIENEIPLLHADRDYAGFEEHLGLQRWPLATQT